MQDTAQETTQEATQEATQETTQNKEVAVTETKHAVKSVKAVHVLNPHFAMLWDDLMHQKTDALVAVTLNSINQHLVQTMSEINNKRADILNQYAVTNEKGEIQHTRTEEGFLKIDIQEDKMDEFQQAMADLAEQTIYIPQLPLQTLQGKDLTPDQVSLLAFMF